MEQINNYKDLGCPEGNLTWTHRSDSSCTTKAFTSSMQAFSTTWTLGAAQFVSWIAVVGGNGNAGVVGGIRNTTGSMS